MNIMQLPVSLHWYITSKLAREGFLINFREGTGEGGGGQGEGDRVREERETDHVGRFKVNTVRIFCVTKVHCSILLFVNGNFTWYFFICISVITLIPYLFHV